MQGKENSILMVENFIGGKFTQAEEYVDSFDPSIGEVWARIPDSGHSEVNDAVCAAKNAFPS